MGIGQELLEGFTELLGPRKRTHNLQCRALDADEVKHPAVQPVGEKLCPVEDLDTFRALLSVFSHGVLDGFPWGCDQVVLGGSAVTACMAWRQSWRPLMAEIKELSLVLRLGIIQATLVQAMNHGAGASQVAKQVCSFLPNKQHWRRVLEPEFGEWFHNDKGDAPYNHADLDLFFVASNKDDAVAAAENVKVQLTSAIRQAQESVSVWSGTEWNVVRTPNSVTICPQFPLRHVQLITRVCEHVGELLSDVDLDCTAILYDGHSIFASQQAIRALETGYNLVSNHMLKNSECVERVGKYAGRGWGSMVFELCRHEPRCDVEIDEKTRKSVNQAIKCSTAKKGFFKSRENDADLVVLELMENKHYDILHVARGPNVTPEMVNTWFKMKDESGHVVLLPSTVDWSTFIEWRRERPLTGGRHRDDAVTAVGVGAAGPCYCCGAHCPPTPSPTDRPLVLKCLDCCAVEARHCADVENLDGCVALVTGGRCKIGYEACLKLLRCGAFVVTSTRFPCSAGRRFLCEPDSEQWRDRLHIYGVDFSHFGMLEAFTSQLQEHYHVNVLINNAAQTLRHPPAYYRTLFEQESALRKGDTWSTKTALCALQVVRELGQNPWRSKHQTQSVPQFPQILDALGSISGELTQINVEDPHMLSSALPLIHRLPGDFLDEKVQEEFFPHGCQDLHGEPLDLRPVSSWTTTLCGRGVGASNISGRELLEVLAVNAAVPFLLFQGMIPVLLSPRKQGAFQGCFVVNVTSAEGMFSTEGSAAKTPEHPHTNMAKAALNMLTKTAAPELAMSNVFCTAVDPGWVSMMRPGDQNSTKRPLPPLSEAEGAARVLAPVFDGVRALREGKSPLSGVLLRNYRVTSW